MHLAIRSDVTLLPAGPQTYVLLDPASGESFEVGALERQLIGLLNGKRTVEELRRDYETLSGRSLDPQVAEEFIEHLGRLGLLEGSTLRAPLQERGLPERGAAPLAKRGSAPLPLSAEDPRGRLNRAFDVAALVFGWLLHPFWILPVLVLALIGGRCFFQDARLFTRELQQFFSTSKMPLLFLFSMLQTLLFLNLPRELMVAMACRRFGARLRTFKVKALRRLLPYFSCEVEESFFALESAGRWTVLSVGLWTILAIGSIAAIGWSAAHPDTFLRKFWMVLFPVCCIVLFARLNPFMPFDSYLMLSVWLNEADLYERAKAEARAWVCGGLSPEPATATRRFWFRLYGSAIYAWKFTMPVIVFASFAYSLTRKFGGAGAATSVVMLIWWYQEAIWRLLMPVRWLLRGGSRWWIRWPLRLALLGCVIVCGFIPYDYEVGGYCRLIPVAQYGVRAQIADEVTKVHVGEGDRIEAGTVIATLAARDERANVQVTKAQLAKAQADLDLLRAGSRPEEIRFAKQEVELRQSQLKYAEAELNRYKNLQQSNAQSEADLDRAQTLRDSAEQQLLQARETSSKVEQGPRKEEIQAQEAEVERLKAQLAHYQELLALGDVSCPITGRIVTLNVKQRVGQYLQQGDLIAVIRDTSRLKVEVIAEQAAAIQIGAGNLVKIRLEGMDGELIIGKVESVAPAAIEEGILDVDPVRSDREGQLREAYERKEDRLMHVLVALDEPSEKLLPGMTGYARIVVGPDLLWRAVVRPIVRFFRVEVWSWLP